MSWCQIIGLFGIKYYHHRVKYLFSAVYLNFKFEFEEVGDVDEFLLFLHGIKINMVDV